MSAYPPLFVVVLVAVGVSIVAAAVTVMLLQHRRDRVDICADLQPQLLPWSEPVECELPYGHRSRWHRSASGTTWTERR